MYVYISVCSHRSVSKHVFSLGGKCLWTEARSFLKCGLSLGDFMLLISFLIEITVIYKNINVHILGVCVLTPHPLLSSTTVHGPFPSVLLHLFLVGSILLSDCQSLKVVFIGHFLFPCFVALYSTYGQNFLVLVFVLLSYFT